METGTFLVIQKVLYSGPATRETFVSFDGVLHEPVSAPERHEADG